MTESQTAQTASLDPRSACWAMFVADTNAAWTAYKSGGSKLQLIAALTQAVSDLDDCLGRIGPAPTGTTTTG